jgi:hypothetical protein
MDNFDLRKYLAEGKLNENLQIDDLFGEYVAQWSQGNYDYDFAELKPGPVKGSLVDDFTLGPDEYDDDDYIRDYKMMRDYLLKNKSYELSQDEKEGLSQFPVQFSLEDDGETIRADIYFSPEYMKAIGKEEVNYHIELLTPEITFNVESGELADSPYEFGTEDEIEDGEVDVTTYTDADELDEFVFGRSYNQAKYFEKEHPGLFKVVIK